MDSILEYMKDTLANALRKNDLKSFQELKYAVYEDGQNITYAGEDFTDVNFDKFSMGFTVFRDCTLVRANHLYGQPIIFIDCDAREIDFRDSSVIISAYRSDFSDMKINENTEFANGVAENPVVSEFHQCKLDDTTRKILSTQGVKIVD